MDLQPKKKSQFCVMENHILFKGQVYFFRKDMIIILLFFPHKLKCFFSLLIYFTLFITNRKSNELENEIQFWNMQAKKTLVLSDFKRLLETKLLNDVLNK